MQYVVVSESAKCDVLARLKSREIGFIVQFGETVGDFLPWHGETDAFRIAVVEFFLRRTARAGVERLYEPFIKRLRDPESLLSIPPRRLEKSIAVLGLRKQRTKALTEFAREALINRFGVPCNRERLLEMPHVGPYIADAIRLYAYRRRALPLDAATQRVLRRIAGLPDVRCDPYKDWRVIRLAIQITGALRVSEIQAVHRALLWLLWEVCGPRPRCNCCPIRTACRTGSGSMGASQSTNQTGI